MKKRTILLWLLVTGLLGKAEAQKGETSIAAGILFALPTHKHLIYEDNRVWNYGMGLEGIGQYNFSQKSAALLQVQFTRFSGYTYFVDKQEPSSNLSISLKAGYRYQFTTSGFYANLLAGAESDYFSYAVGIGKRFNVKDIFFFDTGIDYTDGFIKRFNMKVVFSLLRRPKPGK